LRPEPFLGRLARAADEYRAFLTKCQRHL